MKMNIKKVSILVVPAIVLGLGSQECSYSKSHVTDVYKVEHRLDIHSDESDTSSNLEVSEVNFPELKIQVEKADLVSVTFTNKGEYFDISSDYNQTQYLKTVTFFHNSHIYSPSHFPPFVFST